MPEAQKEGAGRCVLIVDDDASTLHMMEIALNKRGYEVQTATSAPKALDLIERGHFDAVIADIVMPEMDGFAFLAAVRKRPDTATTPFIFLTADRTVKSKVKGLDLGVDEYITKPCVIDELYARLAAMIRRRVAAEARSAAPGAPQEGFDLTGRIAAMPLHELIQVLEVNRKTGVLRLSTKFGQGELYIEKGVVSHATFAGIDGEEGIYLMFAVEEGTFDFRTGVEADMRTVTANTQSLLLEGMRRMDETKVALQARDKAMRKV